MDLKQKVQRWATFLANTRKFFDSRGFFEVTTPLMVEAGAFESCIDTLKVTFSDGKAELNSSPEIEMKALLAQTDLPIYQLAKSFRDDPSTHIHFKEFTMLEFYQTGSNYRDMKTLLKEFIQAVAGKRLNFREITMHALVKKATGIDLEQASTTALLKPALEQIGFLTSPDDTWDDLFLKLLVERVESSLNPEEPTLVTDYPSSFAALAAVNQSTGYAERFELYWKGIELANGCSELTDLKELHRRFETETAARNKLGKIPHPYPHRLFQAVERLAPCAGIAVGMDRLFMCLEPLS